MPKKSKKPSDMFAGSTSQQKKPKTKTAKPKKSKKPRSVSVSSTVSAPSSIYTTKSKKLTNKAKTRKKATKKTEPKIENPFKSYKGLYEQQFKRITKYLNEGIEEGIISKEKAQQFINDKAIFKTKKEYENLKSITKKQVLQDFANAQGLERIENSKEYNRLREKIAKELRKAKQDGLLPKNITVTYLYGKKPKIVTKALLDRLANFSIQDIIEEHGISTTSEQEPIEPQNDETEIEPVGGDLVDVFTGDDIPNTPVIVPIIEDEDDLPLEEDLVLRNVEELLTDAWRDTHSQDSYWDSIIQDRQNKLAGLLQYYISIDGRNTVARRCQENPEVVNEATTYLLASLDAVSEDSYNKIVEVIKGSPLTDPEMEDLEPEYTSPKGY